MEQAKTPPPETDDRPARPAGLSRAVAVLMDRTAAVIGRPFALVLACLAIALWGVASLFISGVWEPFLDAVSVFTFLMVFVIQSTQNRDGAAIQAKLDELIRALEPAKNKFMGIEKLTIEEVHELREESVEEVRMLEKQVGEGIAETGRLARAEADLKRRSVDSRA
jgi:low affinity Fe/Cu permease